MDASRFNKEIQKGELVYLDGNLARTSSEAYVAHGMAVVTVEGFGVVSVSRISRRSCMQMDCPRPAANGLNLCKECLRATTGDLVTPEAVDRHLESEELPKQSERSANFHAAKRSLSGMLLDLQKAFSLTPSERFALLSEEMRSLALSCVRSERGQGDA